MVNGTESIGDGGRTESIIKNVMGLFPEGLMWIGGDCFQKGECGLVP